MRGSRLSSSEYLAQVYRTRGTHRLGGSARHRRQVIALRVRGAFTNTKERGM